MTNEPNGSGSMMFDPDAAAKSIGISYRRYLKTRYLPMDTSLRGEVQLALDERFESEKGPYRQSTPMYASGKSLSALVSDGLLHDRFAELETDVFPADRPLYLQQEHALRKAVQGRNLIIATGTGSGKTECYLFPILDYLLKEGDAGTLARPGVRAMLLYPMNALANDQMQRIRDLLKSFPEITFGRYIGETEELRSRGEDAHEEATGGPPDPGELVSREQMRDRPPHILLTNYAMLEYLLLRPVDTRLFDGPTGEYWRWIVLDEIHVYNGARGAEIAMLLRRLRDRVARSEPGRLQYIGTSATLGSGESAASRIAEFASKVFGEAVEYHETENGRQDVVTPSVEEAETESPARYHYFLRALEGAFVCQSPSHDSSVPRVQLERHRTCPHCVINGVDSQMFELGLCVRCGADYLVGRLEDAGTSSSGAEHLERLVQAPPQARGLTYLLIGKQSDIGEDDEDEAAIVDDDAVQADVDLRYLCTACGCLSETDANRCGCRVSVASVPVVVARPKRTSDPLRRCPACSGRINGEIVLRFFTGQDAPVAVAATGLYQALPPGGRPAGELAQIGEGRKLLTFADSRQDAAFFAPYLERTYGRAIQRRMIWLAIQEEQDQALRFGDLIHRVLKLAEENLVIDPDESTDTKRRQVETWLMAEVLATDRRQSLDGCGLAEISVAVPSRVQPPSALRRLGFSDAEILDMAVMLLETLRNQAAVWVPDGVRIDGQEFSPRNVVTSVRVDRSAGKVLSWLPTRGKNRRMDYVRKVLKRRNAEGDERVILEGFWKWFTARGNGWDRALPSRNVKQAGTTFAISYEWIQFVPATSSRPAYECDNCRQITWRNVSDVCPTWQCEGSLRPLASADLVASNHYQHLYTSLIPSGMSVQEHTGQLAARQARDYQQDFLDGRLNTLSCTTTFELGVDVGDVQAVLMRNVPPTPANYVQRAGRAGRRADKSALIVTFAQRRSHDLYHFKDPQRLIQGIVEVPIISLRNLQIVRRHIHAVAFAAFQRHCVEAGFEPHMDVASFFLPRDEHSAAVDEFVAWLRTRPEELGKAITRITPESVAAEIGIDTWKWIDHLTGEGGDIQADESAGTLTRATDAIRADLADIDRAIKEANEKEEELSRAGQNEAASRQAHRRGALRKVQATLEKRRLIDYLATRVVLPKYGFPVDVAVLDLWKEGDRDAGALDLSRDLRWGITEYAPGSRGVANKSIWQSDGLRTLPGKALYARPYSNCRNCGDFRVRRDFDPEGGEPPPPCDACGNPVEERQFVVPQFGFVGHKRRERPGEARPPRAGWARSYFSDYEGEQPSWEQVSVGSATIDVRFSRQGQITAINDAPASRGFLVCLSCGHGEPLVGQDRTRSRSSHTRPGLARECNGGMRVLDLGHTYLTDVLELNLRRPLNRVEVRSTLQALLAAAPVLGIPTEDVDGTLRPLPDGAGTALIVFDAVPGGAGYVRLVREELARLVEHARKVVDSCMCDMNASCYSCLRTYRNQAFHDELVRGAAHETLNTLLSPLRK